jgi:eukaryotic-like serine/threonine-protein kinase
MWLAAGTRLGPYEIVAPLGAGGMGEVYRALDTRLGRDVAIKVLPARFASDPALKERFQREARAVSSLSHPHICVLHDIGSEDGVDFLVMEYLEGETLEHRLQKGPLPGKQVLEYGIQICDALDKAHRQGIVHRDLKPGNIMLTKAGATLMDFGLAKLALEANRVKSALDEMTAESKKLTAEGAILGTFQYMAPEQLEGAAADTRTDIFALGGVLYEMATGKPAFKGKTKASLIASILSSEPQPIGVLQPMMPVALDEVVKLCLAKDPEQRWQTAHDVKLQLKRIAELGSQSDVTRAPTKRRRSRERALWALAVLLLAVAAVGAWWARPPGQMYPIRFELSPIEIGAYDPVISPSGKQIAFVVFRSGSSRICVRPIDSLLTRTVPGTEEGDKPFWSPDEQSLGFFGHGKLNKVEIATGSVQALAEVPYGVGGTWSSGGTVVYTPAFGSGLFRINASGGEAQSLTELDGAKREVIHGWPQFLPDGKHILFLQRTATGQVSHISVATLGSKSIVQLMNGDALVGYSEPGYILFVRDGVLMAQPFEASKLRLRGDPFLVADKIGYDANWARALASVSANGTVVYQAKVQGEQQLVVVDRGGKQVRMLGPAGPYLGFRISADEKQVAVDRVDPANGALDIWTLDISRNIFSRLTTNPANEQILTWSPDGRRMVFSSDRAGMYDLYLRDASGKEEPLLQSSHDKVGAEWSRDGKYLVYTDFNPKTRGDLWALPMGGGRQPFPVVQTEANEQFSHLSPDGRWLAYEADVSGRVEVYVVSFPAGTGRLQISNNGGSSARWSARGNELFYISEDRRVMAVAIKSGEQFEASAPKALFAARDGDYAVLQKGQQFVFSSLAGESRTPTITVFVNWATGLKK